MHKLARLTALFLWTLQSTANGNGADPRHAGAGASEGDEEGEDEASTGPPKKGYTLIYDVARRFAQPLGIHLENWEGRIIEIEKGVVRLIPVTERSRQLFGEQGAGPVALALERSRGRDAQFMLFPEQSRPAGRDEGAGPPSTPIRGSRRAGRGREGAAPPPRPEPTTLDRVHAAMLLQASGQAAALRALLKTETERSPGFLRLANALSALYPKDSEEKRLLDAMLLAAPRS